MGVVWSMFKAAARAAAEYGAGEDAPSAAADGAEVTPHQTKNDKLVAPYSRSYDRTLISTILESRDGGVRVVGQTITIGGWVRTGRGAEASRLAFLDINDGTTPQSLQAKVPLEVAEEVGGFSRLMPSGTSVLLQGRLTRHPKPAAKQKVELSVSKVKFLGACDNSAGKYPLAKKKMTMEYLRGVPHLRPRTATIAAAARIRNTIICATHGFFQSHGFKCLSTPLMTTSDCEGAGEMFQVTTLLSGAGNPQAEEAPTIDEQIAQLEQEVSEQEEQVIKLDKAFKADKQNSKLQKEKDSETNKLQHLKVQLVALKTQADVQRRTVGGILRTPEGGIDYGPDFCHRPIFLNVSGQMQAECYACALSNVYTFGPAFRAEKSKGPRHLAEFWMVEPEVAFASQDDIINLAQDYVQHCCKEVLELCWTDLELLTKMVDSGLIECLRMVATTPFARCTYKDAIPLLEAAVEGSKKFEFPVSWGIDLASEHERHLAEQIFKKPTFVTDHPKDIKPFYMRQNKDGKTVASMDLLVPGIGELIGGSQREDRLDVLEARMEAAGIAKEQYRGYLDLREYGSVPHSGFGMGLERLIMFATGLDNIREAIPFPCTTGHASS